MRKLVLLSTSLLISTIVFSQSTYGCENDINPYAIQERKKQDKLSLDKAISFKDKAHESMLKSEYRDAVYYLDLEIKEIESICPERLDWPSIQNSRFKAITLMISCKMLAEYPCTSWIPDYEKLISLGHTPPTFMDSYDRAKRECK